MKKTLLILSLFYVSAFAFDECSYYSNKLLDSLNAYQKAIKLNLLREARIKAYSINFNSSKVLMNCDKDNEHQKRIYEVALKTYKATKEIAK